MEKSEYTRPSLYGMLPEELPKALEPLALPKFKVKEIVKWCYEKKAASIDQMTTLSKADREKLSALFCLETLQLQKTETAADNTKKWLLKLADGQHIESVLIPDKDRTTLCVSTQVGCPVRCKFCASGLDGLRRNLTTAEIVSQLVVASRLCEDRISNVVIMGMGEPFYNFDNVIRAVSLFHHPDTFAIGLRKITLSTVGTRDLDKIFTAPCHPKLAISLHAPNDRIRSRLIPHANILTVGEIMTFIRKYQQLVGNPVTLEYVLIHRINDSLDDAQELGRWLAGLEVKLNLIPFNPFPGAEYQAPTKLQAKQFADELLALHVNVVTRMRHGEKIQAACGQLRLREEKE